jgi:hypothetical protein
VSIELIVGAVAALVSLGSGVFETLARRKQSPDSITVTLRQGSTVIAVQRPIGADKGKRTDLFYDLQRSRLQRLQNGEKVTIWDETMGKAAAESLEQQRHRFDLLLGLRN